MKYLEARKIEELITQLEKNEQPDEKLLARCRAAIDRELAIHLARWERYSDYWQHEPYRKL